MSYVDSPNFPSPTFISTSTSITGVKSIQIQIQQPEKVSHLATKQNKKTGEMRNCLAAVLELVDVITSLVFSWKV